jgi:hypothetical protein
MKIIKRETYVDLETGIGIEARGPIVACNDDPKLVMAGGPTTFHYSGVYKDERPELGLACESQININIPGATAIEAFQNLPPLLEQGRARAKVEVDAKFDEAASRIVLPPANFDSAKLRGLLKSPSGRA